MAYLVCMLYVHLGMNKLRKHLLNNSSTQKAQGEKYLFKYLASWFVHFFSPSYYSSIIHSLISFAVC